MGNSPSRSELHGEHMSNVAHNQNQETFQAHSYPTKFAPVALPGIHNEYGSSVPNGGKGPLDVASQHEFTSKPGRRSQEQRTPDAMYSMDSLNVCGTNGSFTSSELPPSSISPAHSQNQDAWRPSSYSDESLHTQCRNLSRLHKNFHHQDEDEGLSTSTFDSDSLNPDATLSGMTTQRSSFTSKGDITPKPEVAEEVTEAYKSSVHSPQHSPQRRTPDKGSPPNVLINDFGITINGRKVSTCEETPLPIILASQKEAEIAARAVSSKIGITSSDLSSNGNSKSRGRMKSPPPPPPPQTGKQVSFATKPNGDIDAKTIMPDVLPQETTEKKRSSSLSSLLRRNVFSHRRVSVDASDTTPVSMVPSPLIPILSTARRERDPDDSASPRCSPENDDSSLRKYTEIPLSLIEQCVDSKATNYDEYEGAIISTKAAANEGNPVTEHGVPQERMLKEVVIPSENHNGAIIRSLDVGAINQSPHGAEVRASSSNFHSSEIDATTSNDNNGDSAISPRKETGGEEILYDDSYQARSSQSKAQVGCKDGVDDDDHLYTTSPSYEGKPVSCSPNGDSVALNSEEKPGRGALQQMHSEAAVGRRNNDHDESRQEIITSHKSPENLNGSTNNSGRGGGDDGERHSTLDGNVSKFGILENRGNTPPKGLMPLVSSTTEIIDGGSDVVVSKSRRSSSSSTSSLRHTTDLMPPASNGILNCNRLSLCSQPDSEVDVVDGFDSMAFENQEYMTIQDQPLSNNSSMASSVEQRLSSPCDESERDRELERQRNSKNTSLSLRSGDDSRVALATEDGGDSTRRNVSGDANLTVDVERRTKGVAVMNGGKANGHQRRLSMTKMSFESSTASTDPPQAIASSAPSSNGSSQIEKFVASRKSSFPELYVNTDAMTAARKLSVGSDKSANSRKMDSAIPRRTLSATSFDMANGQGKCDSKMSSGSVKNLTDESASDNYDRSRTLTRTKPTFPTEFLQTLGEIYACKSKLVSSKMQSQIPGPIVTNGGGSGHAPSPPKEKVVTVVAAPVMAVVKAKVPEPSIDGVEPFECQDRSISEYNISPRSAREVVTESMLNCSITSTNSQKSIVTIQELDERREQPFKVVVAELKTSPVSSDLSSVECGPEDMMIPRLTQTKSLTNSATYKKKPTFIRGRVANCGSLPCVEIFEPPSNNRRKVEKETNNCAQNNQISNGGSIQSSPLSRMQPPPLQYCQTSPSDSSASSSIGDSSSESSFKVKLSPVLTDKELVSKLCRENSFDSGAPKSDGNTPPECSLVELSLRNQKTTSDAIISELKKAQAIKGNNPTEVETSDTVLITNYQNGRSPITVAETGPVVQQKQEINRPQEVNEERDKQSSNLSSYRENKSFLEDDTRHPADPPVKAIVNGKHTNSILVNTAPVVAVTKESLTRESRCSGVQTTKKSFAHSRGNIMSPSLSGNYTEMNGIDSETMGASSIHDDELSGQLQQKENHINELHGNVDDVVQTSNKLDGTSFRRVLNEYEKTLSMFIQQIDQLKQRMDEAEAEKQTLIKERDQALEDLRNVESAFSDVHRKYERAKALLENMKSNEDTLIRRDQEMMQRIQNRDKKIDMIKEKAQESIEKMHLDYETRIKEMEFENAKMRAQYRKLEMKLSTLENDVEQKAKENAQLSALCDELINGQVGQV